MKKLFVLMAVAAFTLSFNSCSKDDGPGSGGIDMAAGTFKGKLTLYPANGQSSEHFDAIVTVSKAGEGKLTVTPKAGESYSNASPKTIPVTTEGLGNLGVSNVAGAVEAIFVYKADIKSLNLVTKQQASTENTFAFEGTKQ